MSCFGCAPIRDGSVQPASSHSSSTRCRKSRRLAVIRLPCMTSPVDTTGATFSLSTVPMAVPEDRLNETRGEGMAGVNTPWHRYGEPCICSEEWGRLSEEKYLLLFFSCTKDSQLRLPAKLCASEQSTENIIYPSRHPRSHGRTGDGEYIAELFKAKYKKGQEPYNKNTWASTTMSQRTTAVPTGSQTKARPSPPLTRCSTAVSTLHEEDLRPSSPTYVQPGLDDGTRLPLVSRHHTLCHAR